MHQQWKCSIFHVTTFNSRLQARTHTVDLRMIAVQTLPFKIVPHPRTSYFYSYTQSLAKYSCFSCLSLEFQNCFYPESPLWMLKQQQCRSRETIQSYNILVGIMHNLLCELIGVSLSKPHTSVLACLLGPTIYQKFRMIAFKILHKGWMSGTSA